jgi:branched-chain amino acid transport system ATP-binding protein
MSICHPVVVMARGRVIYEGDAAGVRDDPRVLEEYLGGLPA